MDLITGQRTFCIGLSGLSTAGLTEVVEVPFVDSSGQIMRCSYFKIQGNATQANQTYGVVAELSGVAITSDHVGDAVTNSLSSLTETPNASGVCGVGIAPAYLAPVEAEWHGRNGDTCRGIKLIITGSHSNSLSLMITYGNLYPLNTLRLEQSYDPGL